MSRLDARQRMQRLAGIGDLSGELRNDPLGEVVEIMEGMLNRTALQDLPSRRQHLDALIQGRVPLTRIGMSIQEAIDWTQDRVASTRPLAERLLFDLLSAGSIVETSQGFVLCEKNDESNEDMMRRRLSHMKLSRPRPIRMQKQRNVRLIKKLEEAIEDEIDYSKAGADKPVDPSPHGTASKPIKPQEARLKRVRRKRKNMEKDLQNIEQGAKVRGAPGPRPGLE